MQIPFIQKYCTHWLVYKNGKSLSCIKSNSDICITIKITQKVTDVIKIVRTFHFCQIHDLKYTKKVSQGGKSVI